MIVKAPPFVPFALVFLFLFLLLQSVSQSKTPSHPPPLPGSSCCCSSPFHSPSPSFLLYLLSQHASNTSLCDLSSGWLAGGWRGGGGGGGGGADDDLATAELPRPRLRPRQGHILRFVFFIPRQHSYESEMFTDADSRLSAAPSLICLVPRLFSSFSLPCLLACHA